MATLKKFMEQLAEEVRLSKERTKHVYAESVRVCMELNNDLNRVKQTLFYSLPCGHIIQDDCECRQRGNA